MTVTRGQRGVATGGFPSEGTSRRSTADRSTERGEAPMVCRAGEHALSPEQRSAAMVVVLHARNLTRGQSHGGRARRI